MTVRVRSTRVRRGVALTVAGAAATATLACAPSASADPLDDGQWWRAAMGVDELHRTGAGQGVTVAVIDGPIDSSVPELRGRVASSSTECLTQRGDRQAATVKGPVAGHATSMASLIVGSGKGTAAGGRGISGIAPRATLRHYAVLYARTTDGGRDGCRLDASGLDQSGAATARAIRQAVGDGARVLSISLSVDYDAALVDALLEAYRAGAIVVASTNNDTRNVFWPGIGNGVVTVTHVDAAGNLDSSALRRSPLLDFAAPGTKVAAGAWTPSGWRSDAISDGASQATAITAGGLAALWSAHPDATGNQVLQAAKDAIGLRAENGTYLTWFRRVGQDLPRSTGKTESYGFGIFSPADAVRLDVASLPDTNPMVVDRGVVSPTAQQIAAAVSAPSASPASPSPPPSASVSAPATEAARPAGADDGAETGSSPLVWALAGLVALGLATAAIVLPRRRRATRSDGVDDLAAFSVSHDPTTATDGVAATMKEHSHGGS